MAEVEMCPECKVPMQFINSHTWTGGGTLVESSDPDHRMVLIECDNLDPLFREIETLIGMPIERIVIESKRRATRDYLNRMIPDEIKEQIHKLELEIKPLIEAVNITGHVLGYGDSRLVHVEYKNGPDDYVIERVKEPYSVALWCGDLAGSSEAVTTRDHDIRYESVGPDEVEIKAWPSPRPPGLTSRLQHKEYPYVDGHIELPKCATCGGPSALKGYAWDTVRGVIEIESTGRRVALMGPSYLNAIFDELEEELGEDIPRVIVEAQRRFSKQGTYSPDEVGEVEDFRHLLALRGLGNLTEMALSEEGLRISIQNAALPLMLAGLMQGYFDLVTGTESGIDWEVKDDGTLELEVSSGAS